MQHAPPTSTHAALLVCTWLAACGGDGRPPSYAGLDAGADTPEDDAAVEPAADAGVRDVDDAGDGAVAEPDASLVCLLEASPRTSSDAPLAQGARFGIALRNEGALLQWSEYTLGTRRLRTRFLPSEGGAVEPDPPPGTGAQLEPAVSADGAGFVTVWADDSTGTLQLRARRTSASGALDGDVWDVTRGAQEARAPALAYSETHRLLAAFVLGGGAVATVPVDASAPAAAFTALDGVTAPLGNLALAPLGRGYVLAYAEPVTGHVFVLALDGRGAPLSSPQRADSQAEARGTVSLVTDAQGGALVFDALIDGVRPTVRFRTFDLDAVPTRSEVRVTPAPEEGSFPALGALRGGYAVAYRRGPAPLELGVAFLDQRGARLTQVAMGTLYSGNLPTALATAPDEGRLLAAYGDASDDSLSTLLAQAWVSCHD